MYDPIACPPLPRAEYHFLKEELERVLGARERELSAERRHHAKQIDALETEADGVHRRTVAHLYSGAFDALDVLKWSDVVEEVERAINAVEVFHQHFPHTRFEARALDPARFGPHTRIINCTAPAAAVSG